MTIVFLLFAAGAGNALNLFKLLSLIRFGAIGCTQIYYIYNWRCTNTSGIQLAVYKYIVYAIDCTHPNIFLPWARCSWCWGGVVMAESWIVGGNCNPGLQPLSYLLLSSSSLSSPSSHHRHRRHGHYCHGHHHHQHHNLYP